VREAIDNLYRQGRVHEIMNRDERLCEIAREYARRRKQHLSSLRITNRAAN